MKVACVLVALAASVVSVTADFCTGELSDDAVFSKTENVPTAHPTFDWKETHQQSKEARGEDITAYMKGGAKEGTPLDSQDGYAAGLVVLGAPFFVLGGLTLIVCPYLCFARLCCKRCCCKPKKARSCIPRCHGSRCSRMPPHTTRRRVSPVRPPKHSTSLPPLPRRPWTNGRHASAGHPGSSS